VLDLEQCHETGRLNMLDKDFNLTKYRADFSEVSSHQVNANHHMVNSNETWMKQVRILLLVFSLNNYRLFE
jgi:hypothetical protein